MLSIRIGLYVVLYGLGSVLMLISPVLALACGALGLYLLLFESTVVGLAVIGGSVAAFFVVPYLAGVLLTLGVRLGRIDELGGPTHSHAAKVAGIQAKPGRFDSTRPWVLSGVVIAVLIGATLIAKGVRVAHLAESAQRASKFASAHQRSPYEGCIVGELPDDMASDPLARSFADAYCSFTSSSESEPRQAQFIALFCTRADGQDKLSEHPILGIVMFADGVTHHPTPGFLLDLWRSAAADVRKDVSEAEATGLVLPGECRLRVAAYDKTREELDDILRVRGRTYCSAPMGHDLGCERRTILPPVAGAWPGKSL